ncbi:VOC family protein [Roseibacillus ishigakijimensis]|uniref:VOC family protein n=1 Tax=Roseibacillus ishigakijimensis TaxID=454146 RepID=A0A934RMK6_9BACT|nr:VOC family protein [Roseibacillus ishigakijimensis]MBK1833560.1 VOC family protein [Roseibacillus ishigakijimensis]
MNTHPYLFFDGTCEEALSFYQQVLGAEIEMISKFRDCPDPLPPGVDGEAIADKVMHASFKIGDSLVMASDSCCEGEPAPAFAGFALSLNPASVAEAREVFDQLAAGGEVEMPLAETFWSPCFGLLQDRFKMKWMINVEPEGEAQA